MPNFGDCNRKTLLRPCTGDLYFAWLLANGLPKPTYSLVLRYRLCSPAACSACVEYCAENNSNAEEDDTACSELFVTDPVKLMILNTDVSELPREVDK